MAQNTNTDYLEEAYIFIVNNGDSTTEQILEHIEHHNTTEGRRRKYPPTKPQLARMLDGDPRICNINYGIPYTNAEWAIV